MFTCWERTRWCCGWNLTSLRLSQQNWRRRRRRIVYSSLRWVREFHSLWYCAKVLSNTKSSNRCNPLMAQRWPSPILESRIERHSANFVFSLLRLLETLSSSTFGEWGASRACYKCERKRNITRPFLQNIGWSVSTTLPQLKTFLTRLFLT